MPQLQRLELRVQRLARHRGGARLAACMQGPGREQAGGIVRREASSEGGHGPWARWEQTRGFVRWGHHPPRVPASRRAPGSAGTLARQAVGAHAGAQGTGAAPASLCACPWGRAPMRWVGAHAGVEGRGIHRLCVPASREAPGQRPPRCAHAGGRGLWAVGQAEACGGRSRGWPRAHGTKPRASRWAGVGTYRPCSNAHACTHARMHACTHARMHACTHARMHACTHARMHACTHARMHMYTHVNVTTPLSPTRARIVACAALQQRAARANARSCGRLGAGAGM
jgi:hypothetical protein